MRNLSAVYWRWLQAQLQAPTVRSRRRQNAKVQSPVDGPVEQLESRELLTVTYHGGSLLTNVEAQGVYLGTDWNNSTALHSQASQLDQFISTLVRGGYMDMLTQAGYNVGRGTSSTGVFGNFTLNKTSGITDAQIQSDLQAMITSGQVQIPDANRLYVVYVAPGVVVHDGSDASNTTFLGYHGAFGGRTSTGSAVDIHYAVLPYPGSPNFTASSQGFASNFDELTAVSSHEIAEAVTDPNVNYKTLGWYDDRNNGEIGDLTSLTTQFSGYLVQELVNKNDQPIAPTTTPTPPPTPTLLAPKNVSVTATSSTTAQLSWSSVSGAEGYRIYQVVGSQSVLLTTLSASSTSTQVSGLTAGSRVSFIVEAFKSTTIADSQAVSVTLPAAPSQTLRAPSVTASALSTTTGQLNWHAVDGAQGYRIYVANGTRSILLGTVSSGTTGVQITGLTPGTTTKFLVEAFNTRAVADSAWVSVVTPAASTHHNSPSPGSTGHSSHHADPITPAGFTKHHGQH